MDNIDYTKIPEDLKKKLLEIESRRPENQQIQILSDVATMLQEVISVLDAGQKTGEKSADNFGALLMDMRESLSSLESKKPPEMPDHAKPVVEAVEKLSSEITKQIAKIDVKPNVKVDAPQVNVDSPSVNVDLKGVEKAVAGLAKAFQTAIKGIPKTEIPKPDYKPLLKAWEGISEQLVSIENATRMKPLPGSMTINNNASNPVPVSGTITSTPSGTQDVDTGFQKDIFGYQMVTSPYNQIELRGDDSDWADFVTETNANGGDTTQTSGLLSISTSTAATGSAILSSVDTVKYRPGVGVYGAGTAIFTTATAGSNQYFGLGSSTAFANGVQVGYKGTSFGIRYMRGGVEQAFVAQADWDDPCLGGATSNFTRGGTPEALDPLKDNLYRIEAGLFGFAGWSVKVWSPDNGWITVYVHEHINTSTTPVFESNTFYMVASAIKTSGATNIIIKKNSKNTITNSKINNTLFIKNLLQKYGATLKYNPDCYFIFG